jgi:hypothetical protein
LSARAGHSHDQEHPSLSAFNAHLGSCWLTDFLGDLSGERLFFLFYVFFEPRFQVFYLLLVLLI